MRVTRVLVPIVVAAALASARAEAPAAFTVEIRGASWQSEAIAAALRADLADVAQPALVVRGELAGTLLRYSITGTGSTLPIRGVVELAGLDRARLSGILHDALRRTVQPDTPVATPATLEPDAGPGVVVGLGVVFAVPLVVGFAVARRRALRSSGVRRAVGALVGLAGIYVVLDAVPPSLVMLGGGLAWGALVAVTVPVALPSVFGLHRVEHRELVPVLSAWLALAIQRTLALAAVVVPIGLALWLAGDALELPARLTFGVVAPVVGLAVRLVWRTIAEVLAMRLDDELVDGDATTAQPWHPQVRGYFVGYLHRANLAVDELLLEGVVFLPGREPDVVVYGGGLTHTRVVIPRAMLEHALTPYGRPHDYAMPRVSTLHWTHWNSGVVMPTEPGAKLATREDRMPHATPDEGAHERVALGEPPTLSGIIEPTAFDPRTSYRPNEDPLWLDWDPGEEFDGTDAGDRDLLFGVLVHAMGRKQRHEDRAAAIGLALRRSRRRPARLLARAVEPVRRFAARRTAALGDTYAALGGARHHLAQYLAWLAWRRDDLSTARAHVPELEKTSRAIVRALDTRSPADPALLRRLDHLRLFITGDRAPRRSNRRLALAVTVLVGLAAVGAVVQAVLYHPR